MRLALLSVTLLSMSCGNSPTATEYTVTATFTVNDFLLLPELEAPQEPNWLIYRSGPELMLEHRGNNSPTAGATDGDVLRFSQELTLPCVATNRYDVSLTPDSAGGYLGEVSSWVGFCSGDGLLRHAAVRLTPVSPLLDVVME